MKEFIKLLFGIKSKGESLEDLIKQRDEALELFKIADSNVRLLQGTINTKQAMLNHYGIREAKKKKHIIDTLKDQLQEQKLWAVEYGNQYVNLKHKVDESKRISNV